MRVRWRCYCSAPAIYLSIYSIYQSIHVAACAAAGSRRDPRRAAWLGLAQRGGAALILVRFCGGSFFLWLAEGGHCCWRIEDNEMQSGGCFWFFSVGKLWGGKTARFLCHYYLHSIIPGSFFVVVYLLDWIVCCCFVLCAFFFSLLFLIRVLLCYIYNNECVLYNEWARCQFYSPFIPV